MSMYSQRISARTFWTLFILSLNGLDVAFNILQIHENGQEALKYYVESVWLFSDVLLLKWRSYSTCVIIRDLTIAANWNLALPDRYWINHHHHRKHVTLCYEDLQFVFQEEYLIIPFCVVLITLTMLHFIFCDFCTICLLLFAFIVASVVVVSNYFLTC